MKARNAALTGVSHLATTAGGRAAFYENRHEDMPPINKIKLRHLLKPASASGSAQNGPGNATSDAKNGQA